MSILIDGIDMPKCCEGCRMLDGRHDDGFCHAAQRWLDDDGYWLWHQYTEGDIDDSKPVNCPLVPVPPHGRLIDADALKAHYSWWAGGTEEHTLDEMKSLFDTIIDLQPTIANGEVAGDG